MTRFRANRRLWFGISLVLLVVPCFVPMIELNPKVAPAWLWLALFDARHSSDILAMLAWFVPLFGVPAMAIGWVLQCLVVMIRAGGKQNKTRG